MCATVGKRGQPHSEVVEGHGTPKRFKADDIPAIESPPQRNLVDLKAVSLGTKAEPEAGDIIVKPLHPEDNPVPSSAVSLTKGQEKSLTGR